MKILFITDFFITTNANSLCIKSVVDEFVKRGHHCSILTNNGISFDSKKSNQYIDNGKNSLNNRFLARIQVALSYFSWPLLLFSKTNTLYRKATREIDSGKFDVIVCYCNPSESLLVGRNLKEKYGNKIKYYAYFLDSIFSGPIPTMFSVKRHDEKALKFEHKVLENADGIIMMRAAKKKYVEFKSKILFFSKIKFLDLPLYNPQTLNDEKVRKHFPSDQKVLFFAGSMPWNIRDPRFLLNVFSKIEDPSIHLYLVGKTDFLEDIQKYSHCNIHFLGLQPHCKVMEMMYEADLLVNIGNNLKGMVPSKIFEYMSTGKPIISTVKIKEDPASMYFQYYKNSLLLDEQEIILDSVLKLQNFINCAQTSQMNSCDKTVMFYS
ncbi:glycosyltransferase [Bacteroidales bacterium OttesenSCG-928-L03]|nr:glycosyltransferase [Bacteroidales bacterium OttesenSCG-928-L03]